MKTISVYKPIGLSPLQTIKKLKAQYPEYAGLRLGAAGRLDPMAEGLLLLMVDEENKRQDYYLGLHKSYEVELALGITTDSYDLLGMATLSDSTQTIAKGYAAKALQKLTGDINQAYPPYSAVRVEGKPLFWWARQNRLNEISVPSKMRTIDEIRIIDEGRISPAELITTITDRINLIEGDFRQDEVLKRWGEILKESAVTEFKTLKLEISCSSGTFVRSIVHEFGQILGTGATATRIIRTRVGDFDIKDAQVLHI